MTVRANLNQLIGGATEETIIARVGEGIVSAIGSSDSHTEVLENPDRISKAVLARRLDSQTAFEIVSIDIADIDVGDNIGARLQADQAEADTRVARANAEGRRAMAVAQEQEMIAQIEEMRAKLVEAEAEIPKAISEAFRDGYLGILDYYKLRNVQADTDMRKAIAGTPVTRSIALQPPESRGGNRHDLSRRATGSRHRRRAGSSRPDRFLRDLSDQSVDRGQGQTTATTRSATSCRASAAAGRTRHAAAATAWQGADGR